MFVMVEQDTEEDNSIWSEDTIPVYNYPDTLTGDSTGVTPSSQRPPLGGTPMESPLGGIQQTTSSTDREVIRPVGDRRIRVPSEQEFSRPVSEEWTPSFFVILLIICIIIIIYLIYGISAFETNPITSLARSVNDFFRYSRRSRSASD